MADMQKELKFHSALLNHWRTIQIAIQTKQVICSIQFSSSSNINSTANSKQLGDEVSRHEIIKFNLSP
jgi:hypothetical protein